MIGRAAFALAVLLAASCASPQTSPQQSPGVAQKREAIRAFLGVLQEQRRTLMGVQVNEYEVFVACTSYHRLFDMVGERPAVLGLELMFAIEYPPYRDYLTDRALAQTAMGGLVTLVWHQRNPVEICPRGEFYECSRKAMSDETLQAMLTPGTPEHALWLADVNAAGDLLEDWRRRGIVVLFRPYHEMNGNWFWWGRTERYPQLWDALYEELAVRRGLDNLIWVWSSDRDTPDAQRFYPRRHAPDIVGIDVYETDRNSPKYVAGRANVGALSGETPFALTEVGMLPSAETMDALNPAWVLLWGGEFMNGDWAWNGPCAGCNTPEQVRTFHAMERVWSLDETPAEVRSVVAAGVDRGASLRPENPVCPARLR
jgi:Glycosyl hydrolase family 26